MTYRAEPGGATSIAPFLALRGQAGEGQYQDVSGWVRTRMLGRDDMVGWDAAVQPELHPGPPPFLRASDVLSQAGFRHSLLRPDLTFDDMHLYLKEHGYWCWFPD